MSGFFFGSLPGAEEKLAPRLLSEVGEDRSCFEDAQGLQCIAGTAPVRFQSGQIDRARIRWHCNKHLRAAVHLWADCSRHFCAWAQAYYQAHRAGGSTHATALRRLGQRWLKILWKMWQEQKPYDPERHARNHLQHGSWLFQLQPKKACPTLSTSPPRYRSHHSHTQCPDKKALTAPRHLLSWTAVSQTIP